MVVFTVVNTYVVNYILNLVFNPDLLQNISSVRLLRFLFWLPQELGDLKTDLRASLVFKSEK